MKSRSKVGAVTDGPGAAKDFFFVQNHAQAATELDWSVLVCAGRKKSVSKAKQPGRPHSVAATCQGLNM